MKKGIVTPRKLSHKNGITKLKRGDVVTEEDVNNFDGLVENGCIVIEKAKKPESDLMKLKKDELQEKCIELDIDYTEDDNKSELVERIEKAEKAKKEETE